MSTFDPEKITFFAKTDARGQQVPFGIKAKDRQRHMYVVGKTGMGKSTMLENMAAQDIKNGEGLAFIDPHGSAAEVLLEYIPEERINDVVYFAPFDLDYPVSFNIMEDVGADKRHLVVSGLMSTFKKVWVDAWSARMEYILTNALLVLIEYPDTTLLSVNRLFVDKAYRNKVVDYCKDPAVKSYWVDEFANYTERFAADALPAIQNKIGQFTGNPLIRNIIGQPHSSFDIREMMDNQKILIMNLSKGLIGETNANLLGSMLTTRIYLAAMSRADLPVAQMKQMPNFYFYVDEFQSFANATFANILSEARKYHLNLIIAHQYIAQMEEEVRDAVFGNVGTTVAFRVGPFDGEVLETVFEPTFMATDLVNLGFAQIYLTLMIDGIGSRPFSAQTLAPIEAPSVSHRGQVTTSSRKSYAKKREDVEGLVNKLHTPEPPPPKSNNKNGKPGGNNSGGNTGYKGGGKPNANAPTKNHAPDSQNKSSEDLRAILGKMTGAGSADSKQTPDTSKTAPAKEAANKTATPPSKPPASSPTSSADQASTERGEEDSSQNGSDKKSHQKTQPQPQEKPRQQARLRQQSTPPKQNFPKPKPTDKSSSSVTEKRSALAAALAAATGDTAGFKNVSASDKASTGEQEKESRDAGSKSNNGKRIESKPATSNKPDRAQKPAKVAADLQSALQAALKKVEPPREQSAEAHTTSNDTQPKTAPKLPPPQPSSSDPKKTDPKPEEKVTASPTITVEPRRAVTRPPAAATIQKSSEEGVKEPIRNTRAEGPPTQYAPQTAPAASEPNQAFDTSTIKKMLHQSGTERSPFIS